MEAMVSILNRMIDNRISLKRAYFLVFGDNMEARILTTIQECPNCSQALYSKCHAELKKMIFNNAFTLN